MILRSILRMFNIINMILTASSNDEISIYVTHSVKPIITNDAVVFSYSLNSEMNQMILSL